MNARPFAIAGTMAASAVSAQAVSDPDRRELVEAAERAAVAAEQAARSARAAADAARTLAGLPQTPAAQGPAAQGPAATAVAPPAGLPRPAPATTAGAIAASVANGPNDSFLKSSATPDLQLVASDKDKVVSLAWTLDVSGRGRPGTLSADQFTLVAAGKFDGESDTGLLGLDGFAKGTQVKLRYIHYGGRTAMTGLERPQVAAARARCEQAAGEREAGKQGADEPQRCNPYAGDGVGPFVARWYPEAYGPMLDALLPGPVWFAGVEFEGDQATYDYLDRAAFDTRSTSRFGFGGSLFGGLLLDRGLTSVTAGFTWRRRLKDADAVTLCAPVAATTQVRCITAADGAPKRDSQSLVTAELRHAFAVPARRFSTVAIAPRAGYDVDGGAWSLELPIYFADNGEGKLRGGVRFGYINERVATGGRTDSVQAGLFVGVPFSVLPH